VKEKGRLFLAADCIVKNPKRQPGCGFMKQGLQWDTMIILGIETLNKTAFFTGRDALMRCLYSLLSLSVAS